MTNFTWKITDITTDDELIIHAKYHVIANDEQNSVETEGNWWFSDKILNKPLIEIKEEDIVSWIENETTINGICHITNNLENQLNALQKQNKVQLPWKPLTVNVSDL
jgi:hypothetical protein